MASEMKLNLTSGEGVVQCSCDHMTEFATLVEIADDCDVETVRASTGCDFRVSDALKSMED